MTEQSVLITGCSSGIGYHCAHTLKQRGYRVFATARKHEDVERLAGEGLESLWLDISDAESIAIGVKHVMTQTDGKLYGLFNNAGYGQPGAVEDLSRTVLREQFETNVFGTLELTNAVLPYMRQHNSGRIIINSSVLGLIALPFRGAYNASKYALEGLFDTLRLELANTGIEVSLIEPGPITSAFRKNAFAKYKQHIAVENSPFRDTYLAMERRLTKQGPAAPFTLGPEAVTKQVLHALTSNQPRAHYYVTFPTYLFGYLKRVLPVRTLDRILLRVSRGEHK